MERVEYNTAIGRNVMNVDDIEDFEKFVVALTCNFLNNVNKS